MNETRKLNLILGGGTYKDNIVYKIRLATYSDKESAIEVVNDLVNFLYDEGRLDRNIETYVREVSRDFVDANLIGDVNVIITDFSKTRYNITLEDSMFREKVKALEFEKSKKHKANKDLIVSIKERIEKSKIDLEWDNKLLDV